MNFLKKLTSLAIFFAVLSFSAFAQNDNQSSSTLPYFNKIVVAGKINLNVDQEIQQSIEVQSPEKYNDRILIYVRDSFLFVVSKIYEPVTVNIFVNDLVYIEGKQNAKIELTKNLTFKNLIVKTDYGSIIDLYITSESMSLIALGSGIVNLSGNIHYLVLQAQEAIQINADLFSFIIDGKFSNAADIQIKGKTDEFNFVMEDECFIQAFELKSRICKITGTDYSEANVYVTDELDFTGKKAASLYFRGEPDTLKKNISRNAEILSTPENNIKYALK